MFKKALATVLAFGLVIQMPLMVYADGTITERQVIADGSAHSIDSDISVDVENLDCAVDVSNGSNVSITGYVDAQRAIRVNNGVVTVNGDIIASSSGVSISDGSVTVNGSIKGIGSMDSLYANSSLDLDAFAKTENGYMAFMGYDFLASIFGFSVID